MFSKNRVFVLCCLVFLFVNCHLVLADNAISGRYIVDSVSENAVERAAEPDMDSIGDETLFFEGGAETALYSGVDGDINWTITEEGTLYVIGKGDYTEVSTGGRTKIYPAPWLVKYDSYIKKAYVELSSNTTLIKCPKKSRRKYRNLLKKQISRSKIK